MPQRTDILKKFLTKSARFGIKESFIWVWGGGGSLGPLSPLCPPLRIYEFSENAVNAWEGTN